MKYYVFTKEEFDKIWEFVMFMSEQDGYMEMADEIGEFLAAKEERINGQDQAMDDGHGHFGGRCI